MFGCSKTEAELLYLKNISPQTIEQILWWFHHYKFVLYSQALIQHHNTICIKQCMTQAEFDFLYGAPIKMFFFLDVIFHSTLTRYTYTVLWVCPTLWKKMFYLTLNVKGKFKHIIYGQQIKLFQFWNDWRMTQLFVSVYSRAAHSGACWRRETDNNKTHEKATYSFNSWCMRVTLCKIFWLENWFKVTSNIWVLILQVLCRLLVL